MLSWKKQFWELDHQCTCLCLLHPFAVPPKSCPLIWPAFPPFFVCFCVEWTELFTMVQALSYLSSFGSISCCQDACVYQTPLLHLTDMCCLLQHCLSDALFHLLLELVYKLLELFCKLLSLMIFSIWFYFYRLKRNRRWRYWHKSKTCQDETVPTEWPDVDDGQFN